MTHKKSVKLLNSLNDVSDDFIFEVQENMQKTMHKKRNLFPIAACLILLLFSITLFASTDWGIYLIEKFTSRIETGADFKESGYDINVNIEKKPFRSFDGAIKNVPKKIVKQYETSTGYSSWFPGHWQEDFTSSKEAIDFIGLEELRPLAWNLKEDRVTLNVFGNAHGDILSVNLETIYKINTIQIQAISSIYTLKDTDPTQISLRTTESLDFEEILYESPNSVKCYILSSSASESGYLSLDGYLVQDGILYNVSIAYQENDKAQAEELLYLWANSF